MYQLALCTRILTPILQISNVSKVYRNWCVTFASYCKFHTNFDVDLVLVVSMEIVVTIKLGQHLNVYKLWHAIMIEVVEFSLDHGGFQYNSICSRKKRSGPSFH